MHFLPLHIVFSVIVLLAANVLQAGMTEVILPDTLVKQGSLIELPLSVKTTSEAMVSNCSVIVSIPKRRIILKDAITDRKSTRLNSSHVSESRMPSSA